VDEGVVKEFGDGLTEVVLTRLIQDGRIDAARLLSGELLGLKDKS
jgi:hypothetical protein